MLRSRRVSFSHPFDSQVCAKHAESTTLTPTEAPQTPASNGSPSSNGNGNSNGNPSSNGNSNSNGSPSSNDSGNGNANSNANNTPVFKGSNQKTDKGAPGLAPGGIVGAVVAAVVVVLVIVGAVIVVMKLRLVKPTVTNKDATTQLAP